MTTSEGMPNADDDDDKPHLPDSMEEVANGTYSQDNLTYDGQLDTRDGGVNLYTYTDPESGDSVSLYSPIRDESD
jgi:hypothetical protein